MKEKGSIRISERVVMKFTKTMTMEEAKRIFEILVDGYTKEAKERKRARKP